MDATCNVQDSIHVFHLVHNMCPGLLNASRRKRIAAGSGQTVNSVNKVISKYEESRKLMKQFASPNAMKKGSKIFKGLF